MKTTEIKDKKKWAGIGVYALIGMLVFLFAGIIFYNSQQQKYDGVRINLLGRQRMLTQKISKYLLLYQLNRVPHASIDYTITLFDSTLSSLIHGGQVEVSLDQSSPRHIPGLNDGELKVFLIRLEKTWQEEKNKLHTYLAQRQGDRLYLRINNLDALLSQIDQAVFMIQKNVEKKSARGNIIAFLLIGVTGITMGGFIWGRLRKKTVQLKNAREHITKLEKLLPICSSCRRIRLENNPPMDMKSWISLEEYFSVNEQTLLTHGICPDCLRKLYPESAARILDHQGQ